MRLPQRAPVIAIAAAMQESRLRNLPRGPGDAIGLFQQRPSQGWGSPAQVRDPVYAATRFYQALIAVPRWQSLPLANAAEAVQHSGQPAHYAAWEKLATALADTLGLAQLGERVADRGRHLRRGAWRQSEARRGAGAAGGGAVAVTSGAAPARSATTAPAWS